jgi:hypothetical protein
MSPTSRTTENVSDRSGDLLPGYYLDPKTGAWLTLPKFPVGDIPSIGYGVIEWAEGRTAEPGPLHYLTGDAWRFTNGQVNFLLWWYSLVDGDVPRWRYRSGVKRGAKGTGKDPLLAVMALAELCGPTRPVRVGKNWVGKRHYLALVQIGANSEGQAKDPLIVANAMVGKEMSDHYGFDKGILRTQLEGGSKIEVLTSSEVSAEGDPATAIFLNESHHMKHSNGGQLLGAVARRNVGKSPGGMARVCEFTNAHMAGEGSVAEDSFEAWQAQVSGKTRRADILYDSREAPPHLSIHEEEQLMEGLAASYADAPWVDLERVRDEAQDLRIPLADTIRYYFNSLPTSEDAWVDPRKFDDLANPDVVLADDEAIAMFLDCSKSTDATTIAAARISDGHVVAVGGWQRPHGDRGSGWLAPRHEVDAKVREWFDRYDVQWFGVDPSPARDDESEALYWAEVIDGWHRDFRDEVLLWATPGAQNGNAVLFDLRTSQRGGSDRVREFTLMAEQTAQAIDEDGTLAWDGDAMLRLHVHNARRRPNQFGVSVGKKSRDSKQLIDYAVSMIGALLGRRRVLNSGLTREARKRSGVVW